MILYVFKFIIFLGSWKEHFFVICNIIYYIYALFLLKVQTHTFAIFFLSSKQSHYFVNYESSYMAIIHSYFSITIILFYFL